MKYKLLKDTPTIKAGTIFEEVISDYDELKELVRITPIGAKTSPQFTIQDIDNFDEWFEKIQDNIHYRPRNGETVFCLNEEGDIYSFTLRKTSDFKPDFENGNGGWVVFYSYADKELHSMRDSCTDSGEPVRYATEEEAKKSIEENEQDWKIYFRIKEEE